MISELSIAGPIAWGLLVLPLLGLFCAALLSMRTRFVRATQANDLADGLEKSGSGASTHSEILGISLPLEESASELSPLGSEEASDEASDIGPGSGFASSGNESPDEEGERLLVDFVSTNDDARSVKLDGLAIPDARNQISAFENDGKRDNRLALLYLQVGEYLCFNGERNEGLEFIRKSIELATAGKNNQLLAQLRLSLGELAVHDKDFTGACEQWQLARELLSNAGLKEDSEEVSAHMYKCGCPTEWVLSDF